MRLTVAEIVQVTGGRVVDPLGDGRRAAVTGISTDTRTLRPGDLFVALKGPRADGAEFIPEAFRRGAAAALAGRVPGLPPGPVVVVTDPLAALGALARFYRRTLEVTVIGVTGSVGKTSTAAMSAAVLESAFTVARTRDDWNAEIGVPLALLGLTPRHQAAVIEMAMRGLGQIALLVEMAQPQIGVVTNVGETHLELLGSRENIARAKEELVAGLPSGGTAILNRDDPLVAGMRPPAGVRILFYGLGPSAEIRAGEIVHEPAGVRFLLVTGGGMEEVRLRTWGRHNVYNALAAAAVGVAMGLPVGEIARGLGRYVPPKMRLQPVRAGDLLIVNDAYNASPASMEAAFEVLEFVGGGRRTVAVLGEMKELGSCSAQLHRDVGAALARRRIDLLVAVAEGGAWIAEGAAAGGMLPEAIVHLPSVEAAVERLPGLLRSGDVVLVKGSRALAMERIVEALVASRGS
ncbi:MAG: UDP-N-acetylmuramoyl-tripeptide--D-alanyl-D-alanine ligase [Armatimonadota bacterium]|nr:UDP-N-acetylmuramoyl-tripeptide--D-alanyl-D-alanine ligase [Armatimonadota bacterium]MDR7451748.1 UDP-N-acetylmuramoyl-tripeptide--D-alanyl-D-alanine ligase [Armatimonadota bacterium]MDR7467373.1 UDP-N-acetylmuramoyl-tripeptide--D-alanyl-D-alanine ligase [Armatimonadota bacterium]MDR7494143.1 UDP-N-acetylmuramoyl-tripeptide--D-alanyl-D-alanine ligase [Armatimonadota bacterium]MDR7498891.1 UDP-N-acetylmuramoyl-tripeptide--D-alanyl-D-alanine ligase [Armatimonadota bacterium]